MLNELKIDIGSTIMIIEIIKVLEILLIELKMVYGLNILKMGIKNMNEILRMVTKIDCVYYIMKTEITRKLSIILME
jgi:hypothetical protein